MQIFGAKAVDSMRMEMGYLHWKADIITEFDPFKISLSRFVKLDKSDFIGKTALLQWQSEGPRERLVSIVLDSTDAPAPGCASLMLDGKVIGTVTSGD